MHIKKWTREAAEAKDEGWIGTCDLCERHIDTHVWHCAATDGPWERGHWLCETGAAAVGRRRTPIKRTRIGGGSR